MLTAAQRLAGLSPQLAQRTTQIGQALEQGQIDAAQRTATIVLAQAPNHPEVLRLCALIAQRRGHYPYAISALQRAMAQRDDDVLMYNALAGAYEAINDSHNAREILRRACELEKQFAPCWFNYGWRLFVDGDVDAAIPVIEHAVALTPHDAQARTLLADALNANGKPQAAISQYRQIIADHPLGAGQAWWSLATLKPTPLDAHDALRLQHVLARNDVAEHERITLSFALAQVLERQGDYAGAFESIQSGHALARETEPYDAAAFDQRVDAILDAFTQARPVAESTLGDGVVFIVSLPRSGSTLTEQILSAHTQVAAGAELPDLAQIILRESQRMGAALPQWTRTHTAQQWRELGEQYLQAIEHRRAGKAYFTDKMPGNWMYVGAILAMLPNARVVVCRRDRLETCLGCYRYMFRRHPYTHDFSDLAKRWFAFDRAIASWLGLYPQRVHEQIYEELVANPETKIRQLLEFCDLPFEGSCLNFHQSQRRVTTPSATQVREPIRADTARANHYAALLDPLRQALQLPNYNLARK